MNKDLQEKLERVIKKREEINESAVSETPEKVVEIVVEIIDVLNTEFPEIQIGSIDFYDGFRRIAIRPYDQYASFFEGMVENSESLQKAILKLKLLKYQIEETETEVYHLLRDIFSKKAYFVENRERPFRIDFIRE